MEKINNKAKELLLNVVYGIAIGIAFIIPGFSGGSIAAILGIYEKLVGAIADLFSDFKKNIVTLLTIGGGMVIGIVSLLFPLGWLLEAYPFPTVSVFVGLAIGGLPTVTDKMKGKPELPSIISLAVPLVFAAALSFLPISGDVNLFNLNFGGYALLVLIGVIGSMALVVPGISGSMLLLILGYYNPIVNMITDHFFKGEDMLTSVAVLACAGAGIIIGFFAISKLMKFLLAKYPKQTYFAIFGFIVGSIPTIYVSTAKDAGYTADTLPLGVGNIIACAVSLIVGFALSFALVKFAAKKLKAEE